MGENAERVLPSDVLLAKAVSKWADTVTWLLLSSGLTTLVPDHMRSTLREECERIRDIATPPPRLPPPRASDVDSAEKLR